LKKIAADRNYRMFRKEARIKEWLVKAYRGLKEAVSDLFSSDDRPSKGGRRATNKSEAQAFIVTAFKESSGTRGEERRQIYLKLGITKAPSGNYAVELEDGSTVEIAIDEIPEDIIMKVMVGFTVGDVPPEVDIDTSFDKMKKRISR
jgi:hypothetical protein